MNESYSPRPGESVVLPYRNSEDPLPPSSSSQQSNPSNGADLIAEAYTQPVMTSQYSPRPAQVEEEKAA